MSYSLPELPYSYDALEPHIDKTTMQIHHEKHHGGYVKKLNAAIEGQKDLAGKEIIDVIANIKDLPKDLQTAVRNNGGGHYNHSLFWQILSAKGGGVPEGKVAQAIESDLGGFEAFKEKFHKTAKSRFGSGWAWLCVNNGKLQVVSTPNQDNPVMDVAETRGVPILGLDVWEHAYYLNYQNKRAEYIDAFWNIVNWKAVNDFYTSAISVEERISQPAGA